MLRGLERALDLLIAERMKRRFGIGRKPRAAARKPPKDGSRHIPHAVQRTVVARDQLQCTFVSSEGKRCSERGWLQLHHEKPFGRGGPATDDNIRVLCGLTIGCWPNATMVATTSDSASNMRGA